MKKVIDKKEWKKIKGIIVKKKNKFV